jgi:hypothetical protein
VHQLTLEDLLRFRRTVAPVTIQCSENRKGELARIKPLEGFPGDAGAVGNAEWSGVPLAELLRRAAPRPGARFVWFEGLDAVTLPDRQSVFGSELPLERAMRPDNLVALDMNGAPLSARARLSGAAGGAGVHREPLGEMAGTHRTSPERRSDNVFSAADRQENELVVDQPSTPRSASPGRAKQ